LDPVGEAATFAIVLHGPVAREHFGWIEVPRINDGFSTGNPESAITRGV
jgi:hypothetical protein